MMKFIKLYEWVLQHKCKLFYIFKNYLQNYSNISIFLVQIFKIFKKFFSKVLQYSQMFKNVSKFIEIFKNSFVDIP